MLYASLVASSPEGPVLKLAAGVRDLKGVRKNNDI
jgi:hypothetical protein